MNSVLEGIYTGVPMICVPFFGDQFYNAESLARQQIGLVINREQDKEMVQQQLTVALAFTLKLNESNVSEDKIEMDKLEEISKGLRQKNIPNIISEAFRVIEDEMGTNDLDRTVEPIISSGEMAQRLRAWLHREGPRRFNYQSTLQHFSSRTAL
ncbi:hypothetical protein niasHT_013113 [Heterodera trifolii]|uniref:glucuronosyltransferase n=1 Tax=Heterodera trifolii TaxID=157864 RepID=A0ABD2L754_9BILA